MKDEKKEKEEKKVTVSNLGENIAMAGTEVAPPKKAEKRKACILIDGSIESVMTLVKILREKEYLPYAAIIEDKTKLTPKQKEILDTHVKNCEGRFDIKGDTGTVNGWTDIVDIVLNHCGKNKIDLIFIPWTNERISTSPYNELFSNLRPQDPFRIDYNNYSMSDEAIQKRKNNYGLTDY